MGRTVIFDAEVQENLNHIFRNKVDHVGLVIGQHTAQKDIVVRLCPAPPKEEEEDCKNKDESSNDKSKHMNSSSGLNEMDEPWLSQFAKEVARTLPGGFDILGIYLAAPAESMNKFQTKLRQILFAVYKKINHHQCFNSSVGDRILLHACIDTFKCVCRTYDVSDYKSTANPAEWKLSNATIRWHSLNSLLSIDWKFPISVEEDACCVKKQVESALKPFFHNIQSAIAIIDGSLRDNNELLDLSEAKKSKQKGHHQAQTSYNMDLLIPLEKSTSPSHSETTESIMMLTFKGNIQCRAFVHTKATVQEAIEAIKQDVIRSITARYQIHSEDLLVIDEEQEDPLVVYELPKRVFAYLPQSIVQVSDYQFHGDRAGDSLMSFKELLNLNLNEDDVDVVSEVSPTTSELIQPDIMEDRLSEFGDNPPKRNILFPVASAAVAAAVAGISYLLLIQDT